MPLDRYGNDNSQDFRLNMLEVIENKEIAKRNPKLFHFGVKSKVGAVPIKSVVNQLRMVADHLEQIQTIKNRVQFSIVVEEVENK